ncbi:hypothetical protein [Bradyrhizobium sp. S3.7.6]
MTEPMNAREYNALFDANSRVEGFGMETTQVAPCPFCAAPDWARWKIVDMDRTATKDRKCENCGRSAKVIIKRDANGVKFEIVQTGGPDQPEWLVPKMRRV